MVDFRNYREIIKSAVAREREQDKGWTWTVSAVNKRSVKIGWGYLDYIGDTDKFTIGVEPGAENAEPEDLRWIIAKDPVGKETVVFIGLTKWDDASTIEEALPILIHMMARRARNEW